MEKKKKWRNYGYYSVILDELFSQPSSVYPITSIPSGCALRRTMSGAYTLYPHHILTRPLYTQVRRGSYGPQKRCVLARMYMRVCVCACVRECVSVLCVCACAFGMSPATHTSIIHATIGRRTYKGHCRIWFRKMVQR